MRKDKKIWIRKKMREDAYATLKPFFKIIFFICTLRRWSTVVTCFFKITLERLNPIQSRIQNADPDPAIQIIGVHRVLTFVETIVHNGHLSCSRQITLLMK